MLKKLLPKFLLSLGIAAFFLWLTVTSLISDAGETTGEPFWASLRASIAAVPLTTLALYALIFLGVHVSRVYRWQFLILPLGERNRGKIFRICAIGFSAIVILPLRLGEMVRPYLLARESAVSMSAALGTAVVERVIDGLLITGILFVCLAVYGGSGGSTAFIAGTGLVSLGIFSGAMTTLILAAARPDLLGRLMQATLGRISQKLNNAILKLVFSFLDGVRVLRGQGVLAPFLLATLVYWVLNAVGIMVLAHGFGFEVSLGQAFALLAILVIGIMIPAGPGFFGNFQFFLSQGLLLFFTAAAVSTAGLAFGLTLNVVQFVIQVGFGIPFFLAAHLGVKKLVEAGLS